MTYRELTIMQSRDILRRWQAGDGLRRIAAGACVDRKTARRYVEAAIASGLTHNAELTEEVVARVSIRTDSLGERERLDLADSLGERERLEPGVGDGDTESSS